MLGIKEHLQRRHQLVMAVDCTADEMTVGFDYVFIRLYIIIQHPADWQSRMLWSYESTIWTENICPWGCGVGRCVHMVNQCVFCVAHGGVLWVRI